MLDYVSIKALAQTMRVKVEDLLALNSDNDPFYADREGRRAAAEWFAELANSNAGFGLTYHLRRAHYRVVSAESPILKPDGRIYQNNDDDWQDLLKASRDARYLELIRLDAIFDKRNPGMVVRPSIPDGEPPTPSVDVFGGSLYELDLPESLDVPGLTLSGVEARQKRLTVVATEKSGQNDVLMPLCYRYDLGLMNFDGESSETGCREMVKLALRSGMPLRVLYLSDFDPGGRSMPVASARKVEYWLRRNHPDLDVTVDPIALLPEQVDHYGLPGIPMKEGEKRAAKFRADFGANATELDALEALHPGELRKIVERAILRHYDTTLRSRVREVREDLEDRVDEAEAEVAKQFAERVQEAQAKYADLVTQATALQDELQELWRDYRTALEHRAPWVRDVEVPQAHDEDAPAPLFDSARASFKPTVSAGRSNIYVVASARTSSHSLIVLLPLGKEVSIEPIVAPLTMQLTRTHYLGR